MSSNTLTSAHPPSDAVCALQQDDFEGATDAMRKIMSAHPKESEPIRILTAICGSGLRALDAIINTRLQKYILRQCVA